MKFQVWSEPHIIDHRLVQYNSPSRTIIHSNRLQSERRKKKPIDILSLTMLTIRTLKYLIESITFLLLLPSSKLIWIIMKNDRLTSLVDFLHQFNSFDAHTHSFSFSIYDSMPLWAIAIVFDSICFHKIETLVPFFQHTSNESMSMFFFVFFMSVYWVYMVLSLWVACKTYWINMHLTLRMQHVSMPIEWLQVWRGGSEL